MAKGTPAAEAFVKLWVDNNELQRGLRRSERMVTRFARRIQSVGVNFARMSAVIAASTVAPIRAFMDWEQASSRFAVTFRNNFDEANEAVERVARNTGKLSRVALRVFNEAAGIAIGGGMNPDEILKTSEALSQMAIDLSEFAKISPTAALNAIGASLSGSGRRMRMYGVDVRETAEEQDHLRRITETLGEEEANRARTLIKLTKLQKGFAQQGITGFGTGTASTFFQAWDEFKSVMQEIAEVVGEHLARGLQRFTSIISANRSAIIEYINRFSKWIQLIPALAIGLGAIGISLKLIGVLFGWTAKLMFGFLRGGIKLLGVFVKAIILTGKQIAGVLVGLSQGAIALSKVLVNFVAGSIAKVVTFVANVLLGLAGALLKVGQTGVVMGVLITTYVARMINKIVIFLNFLLKIPVIMAGIVATMAKFAVAIKAAFLAAIPFIIMGFKLIVFAGKMAVAAFVASILLSFNRLQTQLGGIFQGIDWRELMELGMMERAFEILGKSIKFIFADAIAAIPRYFRQAIDDIMLSVTNMPQWMKRVLGFEGDGSSIFTRGLGKKSQDRADAAYAELQELVALTKQEIAEKRDERKYEQSRDQSDDALGFNFDSTMQAVSQDISRSLGTFFKSASDTLNNPSIDRGLRTQIQQLQEQRNSTNFLREIALNTGLSAVTAVGSGSTSTGGLNFS